MTRVTPARPRVSRETRLLLGIVVISLAALWVLARLRFPDRATAPNPVPTLLTQLTPRSTFEDLTQPVAQLASRLSGSIVVLDAAARGAREPSPTLGPGLRLRDGLTAALVAPGADGAGAPRCPSLQTDGLVNCDPASGLAVFRADGAAAPTPEIWTPRALQRPRYLIAAEIFHRKVAWRPVFIGALEPVDGPAWAGSLWALPPSTEVAAGTWLFTMEGAWAGLVVVHDGEPAIVPGDLVVTLAGRIAQQQATAAVGTLGIDVQPLTPPLAAATGSTAGVVVTWVDPKGPAVGRLRATDVVSSIDGREIAIADHWRMHIARLQVGEDVLLAVRRGGVAFDVSLTAAAPAKRDADPSLGLTMRAVPGVGAEVVAVQPDSTAARAGFEAGDILTVVNGVDAPRPAQILRAFAQMPEGASVAVALVRGTSHRVLVLAK